MDFKYTANVFEACSQISGRNAKIEILTRLFNSSDRKVFQTAVQHAKNPMWTYGVTVPEVIPASHVGDGDPGAFNQVRRVLYLLRTKGIPANNEARNMLVTAIASAGTEVERKFLAQIVNRDLKIGINDFDRWFPGMIPESPVMLCEKWDGEALVGDWSIEPKFDGYRASVIVEDDGAISVLSRGNKEFWNWDHIKEEIRQAGWRSVVFDGEFYAGNFGLTSSICKSQKPHKDALKLQYYIFDVLPLIAWKEAKCVLTQRTRRDYLENVFNALPFKRQYLRIVNSYSANSVAEIEQRVTDFYEVGYEGGVLKNQNAEYTFGRSDSWLKVKPQEDCDLEVIGAEEGTGRLLGSLGALIVQGTVTYKKKKYEVKSNVGGGFKDSERRELWKMYHEGKLVGRVVEVRYQDVTEETSMGEGGAALRFPRFLRLRDDK